MSPLTVHSVYLHYRRERKEGRCNTYWAGPSVDGGPAETMGSSSSSATLSSLGLLAPSCSASTSSPPFPSIDSHAGRAAYSRAMLTLILTTNVPVDAVAAADILRDCSRALTRIIGKPESYVMVSLNGSVPTSFAASEEPAAYGELMSIGGLGPGVNGKLSAALADILETKLSIASNRFYIKFDDLQGYNVGFNGSTF